MEKNLVKCKNTIIHLEKRTLFDTETSVEQIIDHLLQSITAHCGQETQVSKIDSYYRRKGFRCRGPYKLDRTKQCAITAYGKEIVAIDNGIAIMDF